MVGEMRSAGPVQSFAEQAPALGGREHDGLPPHARLPLGAHGQRQRGRGPHGGPAPAGGEGHPKPRAIRRLVGDEPPPRPPQARVGNRGIDANPTALVAVTDDAGSDVAHLGRAGDDARMAEEGANALVPRERTDGITPDPGRVLGVVVRGARRGRERHTRPQGSQRGQRSRQPRDGNRRAGPA